jgi:hypothetical protein
VGPGEDRRRRLAPQVFDRGRRVGEAPQPGRLPGHERANERAVLVERRPGAGRVLLERKRKLDVVLGRERGETERAQGPIEELGAGRHPRQYVAGGSSPTWQAGHQ